MNSGDITAGKLCTHEMGSHSSTDEFSSTVIVKEEATSEEDEGVDSSETKEIRKMLEEGEASSSSGRGENCQQQQASEGDGVSDQAIDNNLDSTLYLSISSVSISFRSSLTTESRHPTAALPSTHEDSGALNEETLTESRDPSAALPSTHENNGVVNEGAPTEIAPGADPIPVLRISPIPSDPSMAYKAPNISSPHSSSGVPWGQPPAHLARTRGLDRNVIMSKGQRKRWAIQTRLMKARLARLELGIAELGLDGKPRSINGWDGYEDEEIPPAIKDTSFLNMGAVEQTVASESLSPRSAAQLLAPTNVPTNPTRTLLESRVGLPRCKRVGGNGCVGRFWHFSPSYQHRLNQHRPNQHRHPNSHNRFPQRQLFSAHQEAPLSIYEGVRPLFPDESCPLVNRLELERKLHAEEKKRTEELTKNGGCALMPPNNETNGRRRYNIYNTTIINFPKSGLKVRVPRGGESERILRGWSHSGSRAHASTDERSLAGYTMDNCCRALAKFVKRKVVVIVSQEAKPQLGQRLTIFMQRVILIPERGQMEKVCVQAVSVDEAERRTAMRILKGLYNYGVIREAELEFNKKRKDFLHPERELTMRLRPYLELSSAKFKELLLGIEKSHSSQ